MRRLLGRLIAAPIRLLALAAGFLHIGNPIRLWSTVWKLGRRSEDGCQLLGLVWRQYEIDLAREMAEKMIVESKDSRLAATAGLLEIACSKDFTAANMWAKKAKEIGCGNPEMLLPLELFLSEYLEEYDKDEIVEQVLSRNDLPGLATLSALICKANALLKKHCWDEAEKIANRILAIQEQPDARIMKWVICSVRGEQAKADEHFKKAQGKLPDAVFNTLVAQGWLVLGQVDKAMERLCSAEPDGIVLQQCKSEIGDLARSEEFKHFYRERRNK